MAYSVEVTEQASSEAEAAYLWMSEHNPAVAAQWFEGLVEAVYSLAAFPNRCPLAPESRVFKQKVRQLLYGRHRILFVVSGNTVYVLHVRHQARKYLDSPEG